MPSEPSGTDVMDRAGSVAADAARGASTAGSASVTDSRNVADGTKNRLPVTARLKSSSRS
jgi:hypothetical protein